MAASLFAIGLRAEEAVTHPFCGVTLITRTETTPRDLVMHIALVDLRAPGIGFKLSPPGGTRETVLQTTLGFLAQEHAQLAINAHFYLPFATSDTNANLVGFAVSDGVVLSPFEPQPIADEFASQGYAILPFAPALNIDPANDASIVHPDPADPNGRHAQEPVTLWTTVSGSAQIVSHGTKTIPAYSGPPGGLDPSVSSYSDDVSWYDVLRARTVIGLTADARTLVLFTVDEAGASDGMTVGEAADLLIRDYHVADALNLDGDGSTSMAIADPIAHLANESSDGGEGRAVGSSLAVFAKPVVAPVLRLETRSAGSGGVTASWSAEAEGWELQRAPDLAKPAWAKVTGEPRRIGDQFEVAVPETGAAGFYRLIR